MKAHCSANSVQANVHMVDVKARSALMIEPTGAKSALAPRRSAAIGRELFKETS